MIVLTAGGFLQAAPGDAGDLAPRFKFYGDLRATLDVTYVSRYIWRGFDSYPRNHSGIQPSLDVDLFGSGFGFNVWWSRANGSGFENYEEIDYTVYYGNTFWDSQRYQTDYRVGWRYYNYPDGPVRTSCCTRNLDMQEIILDGLMAERLSLRCCSQLHCLLHVAA